MNSSVPALSTDYSEILIYSLPCRYGCIHKKSRSDFGSLMEDKSDGRDTPSPFPEEPDLEE